MLYTIIVGVWTNQTARLGTLDRVPPKKAPISGINRFEYQI